MSDPLSRTRYRVAQVWRFRNETPEASDQLVILGVEDHPAQGIICNVHIPYEPMLRTSPTSFVEGCNSWLTQDALDRSVVDLVSERGTLPAWFGSTGEFRLRPDHWGDPPVSMALDCTVAELVREQTEQFCRLRDELASRPPERETPVESMGLWSLIAHEEADRFRELLRQDPGLADRPLPRDESDEYCYSEEEFDECYPLMLAAYLGSVPIAERLLESGADPRRANARGDTALHYAARSSSHRGTAAIIRRVCERGADPNARNRAGQTPLSLTHATDRAAALIESGAPPTLNHAIRLQMLDWVRRELQDNPEAVRASAFPYLVLDDLGSLIREEAERRCGRQERLLRGETPADGEDEWADRRACRQALAERLGKGGRPIEDDTRREARMRHARSERAAFEEYRDLLDAALARGADPNAQSGLFYAVQMIDTSLAEWLLLHGADLNRDVKRGIATYLTGMVRTRAMADLLRGHGARDDPYKKSPHPFMTLPRTGGPRPDPAEPDGAD